jgi:hypothetical protein
METKKEIPNSTAALVLGILSIVFSCFFFAGLILGIIGLVLGGKSKKMYTNNPEQYKGYSSLNAGYIMSIIGTSVGGLITIFWTIWLFFIR